MINNSLKNLYKRCNFRCFFIWRLRYCVITVFRYYGIMLFHSHYEFYFFGFFYFF